MIKILIEQKGKYWYLKVKDNRKDEATILTECSSFPEAFIKAGAYILDEQHYSVELKVK